MRPGVARLVEKYREEIARVAAELADGQELDAEALDKIIGARDAEAE